jgi:hypothetical protein
MSSVPRVHQGLAFLLLTLGLLQFFLAGLGVFGAADAFDVHRVVGNVVLLLGLVLVALAFVGRREALFQSAVLFGLLILQSLWAVLGEEVGAFFGALHPVNGLLVLVVAHQAARALPLPFGPRGTATRRTAV